MKKRFFFDVVLLLSVLYAPWWLVAVLAFFGAFSYPFFYEVIVIGLLMDILYGSSSTTLNGSLGTIGAISIFIIALYAKKFVR